MFFYFNLMWFFACFPYLKQIKSKSNFYIQTCFVGSSFLEPHILNKKNVAKFCNDIPCHYDILVPLHTCAANVAAQNNGQHVQRRRQFRGRKHSYLHIQQLRHRSSLRNCEQPTMNVSLIVIALNNIWVILLLIKLTLMFFSEAGRIPLLNVSNCMKEN